MPDNEIHVGWIQNINLYFMALIFTLLRMALT